MRLASHYESSKCNKQSIHKLGTREVGTGELGTRELGTCELGSRELGTCELGSRELGTRECEVAFKRYRICMYTAMYVYMHTV